MPILKPLIFILIVLSVAGIFVFWYFNQQQKRKRLFQQPFPDIWQHFLKRSVPLYQHLPVDLKQQLHGHINVFLAEKRFEGCDGLEMTDEIRLTIASQACILLLNRKSKYYPGLTNILVYPHAFVVEQTRRGSGGFEMVNHEVRSGESWGQRGLLILSWDSISQSSYQPGSGQNVILHEFAHQLDHEDGVWDGTPILHQRSDYDTWTAVFSTAYTQLKEKVHQGQSTLINPYGATNEAEFFAVLTEHFFDIPIPFKQHHPDLYEVLQRYYRLDPVSWGEYQ